MKWSGDKLQFEVYGTSHAKCVGLNAEGLPRVRFDANAVQGLIERRKAGKTDFSTPRKEADEVQFDCGVQGGEICGDKVSFHIDNLNVKSGDYSALYGKPRPSHADYAAYLADGRLDYSGGGEFSGRLTAPLCVLGGIAEDVLSTKYGVQVCAWTSQVGKSMGYDYKTCALDKTLVAEAKQRGDWAVCGKEEMQRQIRAAAEQGNSVGGAVQCAVFGVKGGINGGKFGSMEGKIASILYLIPALKGVEFGLGFGFAAATGANVNDQMRMQGGKVQFLSNNAGGINGGLTNGADILLCAAFRPTPSTSLPQKTVDLVNKCDCEIRIAGRHDACVVPRAVPVVEAAVAIAVLDAYLANEVENGKN